MLQNSAMLANLNIRTWSARKLDRSVSAEVDVAHSAQDGGRYNKLLINKTALDPLTKHAGKVREYHYATTLPWGDNGDRLLPARVYLDYTATMRKFKDESDKLTAKFVADYPTLVSDARTRLGTLYDAQDYPDVSDISGRFGLVVGFMPVPDAADFRVDVGAEALEEIKQSINAAVNERQAGAVKECWARLYDVVNKLVVMMEKEKPIFRDSIIENVTSLIDMLPNLNITNDADLNTACSNVKFTMDYSPHELRKNPKARAALARDMGVVLQFIARNK